MGKQKIRILFILIFIVTAFLATSSQVEAVSWSSDLRFTTASSHECAPAMAQTTNKRIFMFWHWIPRAGFTGTPDIYYNYTDNGITWSRGFRLTTSSGNDSNPAAVATRDGKIWVFWVTDIDGNCEIYYKNSPNNGASWSSDYRLTDTSAEDRRPSAMQAYDGRIWAVWYSNKSGNRDLWYKIYDGTQWSQDAQLTSNPSDDIQPWVIQDSDGRIWVFWSTFRTGDYELHYKTSIDNGLSWSGETQLTDYKNSWDQLPSAIQTQDGKIWVVWMADRNGQDNNIFYKMYDGTSWSSDEAIVADNAEDRQPAIFQSADTTIWISWASSRSGDYDIFYKKTLNPHDVAIVSVESSKAAAYQGQMVSIEVVAKNHGTSIETFEVKCYAGSTLIGSKTISLSLDQTYTMIFLWDTSSISPSTYTITATASIVAGETNKVDNTCVDGSVQVKIPGDVNGDGIVDVYDAVPMIQDIDATPGSPNWNSGRSDINDDGIVDGGDATILSTNFGRS